MNITVNQNTISAVLNDKSANEEIVDAFNKIIDDELSKENPDFDIIDGCAEAINEIFYSQNTIPALRLIITKKQIMKYCRHKAHSNKAMKAVVAACMVIIISGVTVFNASPALAENVKSFFETVVTSLQQISDETENSDNTISSIYATLPDNTSLTVSGADEVDISKIKVTAIYNDESEKDINISDCMVKKTVERTDRGGFVLVAISYNGCACSIAFELEE